MGWFDGFPFKSREQMEKEQKDFENKVFPFGLEAQRKAALEVLQQLMSTKLKDDQKLFTFISAKDKYLDADTRQQGLDKIQSALKGNRWVSPEEAWLLKAFVVLESSVPSLEEYPSAQQVRELAEALKTEA